jgi:uncharacterized protein YdeI (YjbR/CyaY-like superfamily)
MAKKDKRIDEYIKKAQPFAQPILKHIRELVHETCPDVQETIKWGMPSFDYKGPFFGMAAFKQHAAFGFWKAALMKDPALMANAQSEAAMGHGGKITSLKDLPSDKKMIAYLEEAMELNDQGIKVPKPKREPKKEIPVPADVKKALAKNKKVSENFEKFSPSHRREYLEWIIEAKTEETREKRMATMLEWVAEGKSRNWKYERKKS